MVKTFTQAVKFIEQYIPTPDKKHPGELGLKRMQYLMELLGNPQLKYPTIHVGGTSGKGSTATIIASILATKYKVGLHTSPHLVSITERIIILPNIKYQISNIKNTDQKLNISENQFIELLNNIIPIIKTVENSKYGKPSYFEIVTAMAFLYFFRKKVDFAVIEVGMGGRYDGTNVIHPLVAVLTNVGLDHTEILGDTVEKIAQDKAGIIKHSTEVVTGAKQQSVVKIVESRIKDQESRMSLLGRDFSYKIKIIGENGSVFDYKGFKSLKNLRVRLLGEYQIENAALAIRAVELLNNPITQSSNNPINSQKIKEENIRNGIMNSFIPGRLEIIKRNPLVILDGAHNPDKIKALVRSIKKIFPKKKVTAIIAIKNDKNAKEILKEVLPICHKIIFTRFQLTADVGIISSYEPKELLSMVGSIKREKFITKCAAAQTVLNARKGIVVIDDAKKAIEEAIKSTKSSDLILVTGSLYLVGEIKRKLQISNYPSINSGQANDK